tara:strand:- start:278 stop:475 length:198 start_codon:yes stop_codon:yes gene_type:complete
MMEYKEDITHKFEFKGTDMVEALKEYYPRFCQESEQVAQGDMMFHVKFLGYGILSKMTIEFKGTK